ncbi:MAG TPA: sulfite exporter TauE/SafE family protein, partial [Pseudomonas sp.]
MADLLPLLASALILGLLGGGHCIGMCGGLMGALTLAIPAEQRQRRLQLLLAYNLGRIASYTCAGLLVGAAGWAVASGPAATVLRVIAGLLLIAMGLYLAGWWSGLTRIEGLGRVLWRRIEPLARGLLPVRNANRALLLGA